jgi:hypothetical protein
MVTITRSEMNDVGYRLLGSVRLLTGGPRMGEVIQMTELEKSPVPQKLARINIPKEKVDAVVEALDGIWPPPDGTPGQATLSCWEEFSLNRNEITLGIEGDRHIVEPIIHAVMGVLKS